jgi:hypothetical protein
MIPEDILARELQEKLGAPAISLVAQRVPPFPFRRKPNHT